MGTFCCTTTTRMQPTPNSRLGLSTRPPLPSYGQGPSISALAQRKQQQQMLHQTFHIMVPLTQKRQPCSWGRYQAIYQTTFSSNYSGYVH
ncbi:hypothetical protein BKA82DRAFT_4173186 [Pisolithus tinctorius]|nr:hypothetical protein BKA82DRAFT_4173186 [Pisolithus tinctorius]